MNWRFWRKKPKSAVEKPITRGPEATCERCGHPDGHWWTHGPCSLLGRPDPPVTKEFSEDNFTEVEITFPDGTVKVCPASKFWETNQEWWGYNIPFSDEHPYTD